MSIPPQGKSGGVDAPKATATAGYMETVLRIAGWKTAKDLEQHACSTSHEDMPSDDHQTGHQVAQKLQRAVIPRYEDRCPDRLRPLIPPSNFGAVVPGSIYRSSYPQPENFEFLKSLKLKTILTLVPEPCPEENVRFMQKNGIRHVQIHVPANKGDVQIPQRTMTEVLSVVLDRTNHPLLIHCNKGKHRTGCVISCFRKCQGEALENILLEYHTYADPKARILDEVFIKFYDERTVLWLARAHKWRPANPRLSSSSDQNVTGGRVSSMRVAPTPS